MKFEVVVDNTAFVNTTVRVAEILLTLVVVTRIVRVGVLINVEHIVCAEQVVHFHKLVTHGVSTEQARRQFVVLSELSSERSVERGLIKVAAALIH